MIKVYADYLVPNQYSTGMDCPAGTCTYRDDSSYFVFYDDGELHHADMLTGRNDNAGLYKILYIHGCWWVERQTVSEHDCLADILASKKWRDEWGCLCRGHAMRRGTLMKVLSAFETSPMGRHVTGIIKRDLAPSGYDELYWDYVERHKTLLEIAVQHCDELRRAIEDSRARW